MKDVIFTKLVEEDGALKLYYHVDQNAVSRLANHLFGKTIIFTDQHTWTAEQIVEAYRHQA